jgi:hypothetical protein
MKVISLSVGIFIALLVFKGSATAQMVTAKANYCGSTYGSGAGTFSFMVGKDRLDLEMEFRDRTVKRVRFDLNKLRLGDEFVIKYRPVNGEMYIRSITGTGKRRRVESCDMDS